MGGLNKYKLFKNVQVCSLSLFHSICEGASHSNLIPPLSLSARESEKMKKNFLLNPP